MNTIERAYALAISLGIKTKSNTLRGILRAIKKNGHSEHNKANQVSVRNIKCKRISLSELCVPFQQRTYRVRRIDEYAHVAAALSAALGRDVIDRIGAVPNCYRGDAGESAASAARYGDAVRLEYGRYTMPHASHGHGGRNVVVNPHGVFVRRSEIIQACRLPTGWRWHSDNMGPYIRGHGVEDFHPEPRDIVLGLLTHDWSAAISKALANQEKRRQAIRTYLDERKGQRRERLLARISDKVIVTQSDAREMGACQQGINVWLASIGHRDAQEMPASKVFRHAIITGERFAIAAAIHAARRSIEKTQQ